MKNENPTEIPEELYYNRDDLEKIRKTYKKKAPYAGKSSLPETKSVEVGSAKRNIQRSGGGGSNANHKTGKKSAKRRSSKGRLIDDGSLDDHYDEVNDPNYDSEEDRDGRDLMKVIGSEGGNSPMKSYGDATTSVPLLLQDYKRAVEHIVDSNYLKTLEMSVGELVHELLHECNLHFEEKLKELLAELPASAGETTRLPYYEVVKRSIIKSFDYSCCTFPGDALIPTVVGGGANRMEATSLLLVELCSSRDTDYRSCIEEGFDKIFEIINELNKDVPSTNSLLSCYLTRCIVDEIISPSYITHCLANACDDAIDAQLAETGGVPMPPPPPQESPSVTAKVLQHMQYSNDSLRCSGLEMALYNKERNAHVRDVITKTKTLLSHDHYSSKLQHIWGINSDLQSEESESPSATTRELKHRIDEFLMEFLDNCSTVGGSSQANSRSNSLGDLGVSGAAEYTPPELHVLESAYSSLQELGTHTLTYFAHEIVKRGVCLVLLNYKCDSPVSSSLNGNLAECTQRYMTENPSALHMCQHLILLFHYCMCGEDLPQEATADTSLAISNYAGAISPLPPPVISKLQYGTGLLKFFDGCEPNASVPNHSSLFYDVLLDAPHAPFIFRQLLELSCTTKGGLNLIPSEEVFNQLCALLVPYYKQ